MVVYKELGVVEDVRSVSGTKCGCGCVLMYQELSLGEDVH